MSENVNDPNALRPLKPPRNIGEFSLLCGSTHISTVKYFFELLNYRDSGTFQGKVEKKSVIQAFLILTG